MGGVAESATAQMVATPEAAVRIKLGSKSFFFILKELIIVDEEVEKPTSYGQKDLYEGKGN